VRDRGLSQQAIRVPGGFAGRTALGFGATSVARIKDDMRRRHDFR
jgi:hypothetical protein